VAEVRLARINRLIARIAEIAFGHYPKCSDGRKRPAIVAIEFVPVIAIHHDLSFESAGQFEAFEEDISRIVISFATVPIAATNVRTVARIVWFAIEARRTSQFSPRHLDVAYVIVAVTGVGVEHGSLVWDEPDRVYRDGESIMRSRRTAGNSRSDRVGSCEVERGPGAGITQKIVPPCSTPSMLVASLRPLARPSGIDRASARRTDGRLRDAGVTARHEFHR
jgi:hypothetical protein